MDCNNPAIFKWNRIRFLLGGYLQADPKHGPSAMCELQVDQHLFCLSAMVIGKVLQL
jgi:hypothetical protein